MASTELPWVCHELFSDHYLTERLPSAEGALWPSKADCDLCFDAARAQYQKNVVGLRKGNEEDVESRFVAPLLAALGFAFSNRRSVPKALDRALPDFLLYSNREEVDAAFHEGSAAAYYTSCIGLLEAKRWGHNLGEDASGKGKAPRGRSPHFQIRDYLSESERLNWGVLTNGARWRLYSKRDRASAYFEFDLERVLGANASPDDEVRARGEFRVFYALFRRAAFERGPAESAPLDHMREGALAFREEIEKDLRRQVFDCVELLAEGYLNSPSGAMDPTQLETIYEACLILLYRLLFVLNAEARNLLPVRPQNAKERRYFGSYSLEWARQRLRDPEAAPEYEDDATAVLYSRLQGLFQLIDGTTKPGLPDKNEELGIPRYNGGLFAPGRYTVLEAKPIGDRYLAEVIRNLSYRRTDGAEITFDYQSLGERHLGSIYEGLLEHRLVLGSDGKPCLINDRGERRTQGAYFTPQPFVSYLVEHAIRPRLDSLERSLGRTTLVRDMTPEEVATIEPDDSFANAVLELTVCDPAMGSGHFLVEAVDVLAEAVCADPSTAPRPEINAYGAPRLKNDGSGDLLLTQEARLSYWKRHLAEACIYGVDLNPLAVELAKLSLWLKTVDRVPLNFLDHHLRCGNSLVGAKLESLPLYPHAGNGKNGKNGKKGNGQLSLTFTADLSGALQQAIADLHQIEEEPADTHAAAKEKERLWKEVTEELLPRFRQVADLWIAEWFGQGPGYADYLPAFDDPDTAAALWLEREDLWKSLRPFHWELEFPDIYFDEKGQRKARPGFDVVIGNPPWERIKLADNEFFSARSPAIAAAPRQADRKKLIKSLTKSNPEMWAEYERAARRSEQMLEFVRECGDYPLMGKGDTNLYAVFAEKALNLLHKSGRLGILVPSGIATDSTTREYFQKLISERRLSQLIDFENRLKPFPDVDGRFKFSMLLAAGPDEPQSDALCGFFLHDTAELIDAERTFSLKIDDFRLFNPNTLTCPIFRRKRDLDLTRKIYTHVPVLVDRTANPVDDPWNISLTTMFHMTNASELFKTANELISDKYWLSAGNVYTKGTSRYLPLFEGKMVHQYDHRYAAGVASEQRLINTQASEQTPQSAKADPDYSALPRFWVPGSKVPWRSTSLVFREIARATDVRTFIAAFLPRVGTSNKIPVINTSASPPLRCCLLGNLNAMAFDYSVRNKLSSTTLNFFIVEQLPVLPPKTYEHTRHGVKVRDFISERVLELSYTAHDLKGLADDLGYVGAPFTWDEERRLHLRCQLDAMFFHLYELTRDEAGEILDTFPIVKRQDEARYGKFRTKDLILGYYAAYEAGNMDAWVKT